MECSLGPKSRTKPLEGFSGIMEKKMETTIMGYIGYNIGVYIGIMEKNMETIMLYIGMM